MAQTFIIRLHAPPASRTLNKQLHSTERAPFTDLRATSLAARARARVVFARRNRNRLTNPGPRCCTCYRDAARSPNLSRFARTTAQRLEIPSMAKARGDFTDILIKRGQLASDQIDEALSMQKQTGAKTVQEVLVKLGYVTMQDVMSAL